ncbi:neurotrimin isoform X2 [Dendroctonus ponderosae]|uniref:neurotrimin isoform X2 n=1 Tax=Dendroctonus ponderosae TaxID=77166 RepID=UPI0020353FC5|nr:neurotrimin isoform X2 [Dendroctonus ponderosae]
MAFPNKLAMFVRKLFLVFVVSTAHSGGYFGAYGRHVRNIEPNGISVLNGADSNQDSLPRFTEPVLNVTVTVGRDALLACVVDNLKGFKVAWVRVDTQTILSIHHNVITQNPRISLSYNDHRSWYLHVKNVQEVDRGWYMCQVNTDPMRSRKGYLEVVVSPTIIDQETSSDMVVLESTNVSLTCKATGYPEPYVMWRREDGEIIRYNGENVNVVDGEVLFITKVSRLHMGVYLCIASNGVPPSISKRVQLKVQFPPMLSIPNQLEGAYIGQDVTLECRTEAFPTSINYWTTERGDMIISGDKYEAVSTDNGYKKYMMLKIRKVSKNDFGSYKCVAKNSLGETDGVIKLEEIPAPTTIKIITHHSTSQIKKGTSVRGEDSNSENKFDESTIAEYEYESEYTLPSNGPPPIKEPPVGGSAGSNVFATVSSLLLYVNLYLFVCSYLYKLVLR